MTSAAIAFTQLPYNALCIRIILQHPRSSYGISIVCGDKCDRISGCDSIGPNRSGNIRIVTNQAGQGLSFTLSETDFRKKNGRRSGAYPSASKKPVKWASARVSS